MTRNEEKVKDPQQESIDRTVGLAALRRLTKLVAAEIAQERINLLWAKRLALVFGTAITLIAFIAVIDPALLRNLFRAITGLTH